MPRTITHSQYESLVSYPTEPTQRTVYRADGFDKRLISLGLLAWDGEGVRMTDAGREALVAYRKRYGIREIAAMREP